MELKEQFLWKSVEGCKKSPFLVAKTCCFCNLNQICSRYSSCRLEFHWRKKRFFSQSFDKLSGIFNGTYLINFFFQLKNTSEIDAIPYLFHNFLFVFKLEQQFGTDNCVIYGVHAVYDMIYSNECQMDCTWRSVAHALKSIMASVRTYFYETN